MSPVANVPEDCKMTGEAALQSALVKARQIKQGLMQALLTGRIRLVSPTITQGVPA